MSTPQKPFDQNFALQLRHSVRDKNRWARMLRAVEDVVQILEADEPFEEEDSQQSDSEWEHVLTPATFSRRVIMSMLQFMDVERTANLNKLYHGEEELLKEAHRMTLNEFFQEEEESSTDSCAPDKEEPAEQMIEPLTDGERLLLLRAVETKIRRNIDEVARLSGAVSFTPAPTANDLNPLYGQALLSDFFAICQHPNEAEEEMLTEACGLDDVEDTEEWFSNERAAVESVTTAQALLQNRRYRLATRLARRLEGTKQEGVSGGNAQGQVVEHRR